MIQSTQEENISRLPEEVAQAKFQWRKATADKKKLYAEMFLKFKAEDKEQSATEIKERIHGTQAWYDAEMVEATFEKIFDAKYESLMLLKKEMSQRTAY